MADTTRPQNPQTKVQGTVLRSGSSRLAPGLETAQHRCCSNAVSAPRSRYETLVTLRVP